MSEVWLVAGNKGSVGKSVVAKTLVEWLIHHGDGAMVADGDVEADVAKAFENRLSTTLFDLATTDGWAEFTDWICGLKASAPIVANLPDAVTERTLAALKLYIPSTVELGFKTRALFVMNTLPDGLNLLPRLVNAVREVFPVKNLFCGESADFLTFNRRYARHFSDTTIFFPQLNARIMNEIRAAGLSYAEVATARPNQPCSSLLHRLEVVGWLERAIDALDEVLVDLPTD